MRRWSHSRLDTSFPPAPAGTCSAAASSKSTSTKCTVSVHTNRSVMTLAHLNIWYSLRERPPCGSHRVIFSPRRVVLRRLRHPSSDLSLLLQFLERRSAFSTPFPFQVLLDSPLPYYKKHPRLLCQDVLPPPDFAIGSSKSISSPYIPPSETRFTLLSVFPSSFLPKISPLNLVPPYLPIWTLDSRH